METQFLVDFNTGVDVTAFAELGEAKMYAEDNALYTGEKISIRKGGVEVAYLPWYGTTPTEDDEVTEAFGSQGFYGAWVDL